MKRNALGIPGNVVGVGRSVGFERGPEEGDIYIYIVGYFLDSIVDLLLSVWS
jgi:hypothetical protein